MSITWWEKTVEYEFVMGVARYKNMFLAPLDGTHEKIGDLLFSLHLKWILIEFKRDQTTIKSEIKKFVSFQAAKAALSQCDGHHHIVYGRAEGTEVLKMKLAAQTYFSGLTLSLADLLKSGIDLPEFNDYVEKYTSFKKSSSTGTGGITMEEFSMVAGVNSDGDVTQCISLSEFKRALKLEIVKEKTLTIKPPGRTL